MSTDAKVGTIFVLIAASVAGTVLFLGGPLARFRNETYVVRVFFADVNGLERGADVRTAGVRIGRVRAILLPAGSPYKGKPVMVVLEIQKGVALYSTDQFLTDQADVLGGRFISIHRVEVPGATRTLLGDGSETANSGTGGYAALSNEAQGLMAEARATMEAVRATVVDPDREVQIRHILANVDRATRTASEVANQGLKFATQLARIASRNDARITDLVENLRLASGSVQRTAAQIHQLVSTTPLPAEMARAGEELRAAAQDVHATTSQARDIFTDPELHKHLDGLVADLRKASENVASLTGMASKLVNDQQVQSDLKTTVANIRESAENVKQSTDAVRKLLTDTEVTGDIKATVRSARLAAERGADIAAKASKSLDRVDHTMDSLGSAVASVKPTYTKAWLSSRLGLDEGLRSDFNWDLHYGESPDDFWRLGIADIGRDERLTLQKSMPIGTGRVRGGLLYGKLGVGYDRLWGRGSLELDVFDPDRLTLDVRGVYRLQDNWDLVAGVDQAFNRNHPFIGARRWFGDEQPATTK
jgi:ABC-type transporter Mla subunit MlaD